MKAKIYTKTGDSGSTTLVGGERVQKTHPRLDAYGTLDELNSVLGLLRVHAPTWDTTLQRIQNCLFNLGSQLACEDESLRQKLPDIPKDEIHTLESQMDTWENALPPLTTFILPGGSVAASFAHLARTVCRRAERHVVRLSESDQVNAQHLVYLNRLSDWLFMLARQLNREAGQTDLTWTKLS